MSATTTTSAPGTRLRGLSSGLILVAGVLLVPLAIMVIFNSYDAPDAEAYVRMAFAQVAGATIAIVTVIALVVQRVVRRSGVVDIAWFAFLAIVIGAWQAASLSSAADTLLTRLGS